VKRDNDVCGGDVLRRHATVGARGVGFVALGVRRHFGVHKRSKVWSNSESLWKDVTEKSPNNPRGLMNYGNTQMAKARYTVAEDYFMRALKMWPYYSYLHTNLGVLKGALSQPAEAEQYFKNGIAYGKTNPEAYYFYARWLHKQNRKAEATDMLKQALQVSPSHANAKKLLATVQNSSGGVGGKIPLETALEKAENNPTADNYLNLSLQYYRNKKYQQCIEVAQMALELQPDYAAAYNNICTAYNQLKEWEKAAEACQKALELKPDYELARNNLNWAVREMKK
jgi:tetratricopeptide (TPR) repeat protein